MGLVIISNGVITKASSTPTGAELTANKDQANGYPGLDGNIAIDVNVHRFKTYIGGFGYSYSSVQGTWAGVNNVNQTDFDDNLISSAGYIDNHASAGNLDEIGYANILLNAGTYTFILVCTKGSDHGIIELLHGNTSIGTFDLYNAATQYNQVATFTYTPTSRLIHNLRVRVNGKNAGSSGYDVAFSRLDVFKSA